MLTVAAVVRIPFFSLWKRHKSMNWEKLDGTIAFLKSLELPKNGRCFECCFGRVFKTIEATKWNKRSHADFILTPNFKMHGVNMCAEQKTNMEKVLSNWRKDKTASLIECEVQKAASEAQWGWVWYAHTFIFSDKRGGTVLKSLKTIYLIRCNIGQLLKVELHKSRCEVTTTAL